MGEISQFYHELKSLWAQWDRMQLIDGVFCHQWFDLGTKTFVHQFLVPVAQRREIFNSLHESVFSATLVLGKPLGS